MTEIHTKKTRWFTLIYSLLSLFMLLSLLAFSYATWSNVKQQAHQSLQPHNKTLMSVVQRFFVHQEALLGALAESINITVTSDDLTQIRLNDVLRATPQMRVLAVLDSKGTVVSTTGNIHTLEWFDLFDDNQVTIGRPFRPTFVGENMLPMRKPIKSSNGQTTGYVVAAYRLLGNDAIWQEVEETESKRRSMIIGGNGRVYLSYPESDTFWQSFVSLKVDTEFLKVLDDLARNPGQLHIRDVQYQDESLLITASLIKSYNFYIVSGIQNADLFSRWLEQMKYVALAVLLFLIIGLFVFRIVLMRALRDESARSITEHNVFKLSQAIEQCPNSVIVTDTKWLIEYTNHSLSDGSKTSVRLIPGQLLLETFPHSLLTDDVTTVSKQLLNGDNWYGERRSRDQMQWFSFSISAMTDDNNHITNYVIITQDISERKSHELRLFKQANFDELTGLPNRLQINELLTVAVKNASRKKQCVAVFYIDVDNYKQVNDKLGHQLSNQLLQLVAVRLKETVADSGVVYHLSGDEFLVSMICDSSKEIINLADNILNATRQPVFIESKKLFISVSIGIARYPDDSPNVESLLRHADNALYESKNQGRSSYSLFSRELHDQIKRKAQLESELGNALANNEISMLFQSKNKIGSGDVLGIEALIQWHSPRLGMVRLEELITAAEEIGVIDQFGEFAINEACRNLQKFQNYSSSPLSIAVSISITQLMDSDVVGMVRKALQNTGIKPSALELTINESVLLRPIEEVEPVLTNLMGLGVILTIDDYGTGYSSLSYLTRLPITTLKINNSFIANMIDNRREATLTHTIITMAHKLGFKVAASAVESEEQLALLRVFGCDFGQGSVFTIPLSHEEMVKHLKSKEKKPDWAI